MALEKDYVTKFGVTANYWKISSVHFEWKGNRAYLAMELHLNSASNNKDSLLRRDYELVLSQAGLTQNDIDQLKWTTVMGKLYTWLKNNEPLVSGALDV